MCGLGLKRQLGGALLLLAMLSGNQSGLADEANSTRTTALAPEIVQLKPDVPHYDVVEPKPAPKKSSGPLQGNIRQDNKLTNTKQGLFGSAGKYFGRSGSGQMGRSRNQLPGKITDQTLQAEVESGVGIIGVRFEMYMGRSPVINRVFSLTPAAQQGISIGDVIVAVDGVPTAGLAKEEIYDMIVGKPGTPVTISIQRTGDFRVFNLTRMDLNDISDPHVRADYLRSM